MRRIYVASSWRNEHYPSVVKELRESGFDVYDFRNPPVKAGNENGFKWEYVSPEYMEWSPEEYREMLHHPKAEQQFANDIEAMRSCDTCVIVLPCGRSAHTEAGWFAGHGKTVVAYIPEKQEPELMYKLFDAVVCSLDELRETLYDMELDDMGTQQDTSSEQPAPKAVAISPNVISVKQHEQEMVQLRHELKEKYKHNLKIIRDQYRDIKAFRKVSQKVINLLEYPGSNFYQSFNLAKLEDVDNYIYWFKMMNKKISDYSIRQTVRIYAERGEDLTFFLAAVEEHNKQIAETKSKEETEPLVEDDTIFS